MADWPEVSLLNLSPRLLDRPALVEEVQSLVVQHGLKPEQIMLEVSPEICKLFNAADALSEVLDRDRAPLELNWPVEAR